MRYRYCVVLLFKLLLPHVTVTVIQAQKFQLQFGNGELSECRRIFAVEDNEPIAEAGFLCLLIEPLATATISVRYATGDGWLMEETSAWFNTDIDTLPTNKEGEPRVNEFPFVSGLDINPDDPVDKFGFNLQLANVGVPACENNPPPGTVVQGVAWAALSGEDGRSDGWADGLLPDDPDADLWTLFEFTVECVEIPTTPAPSNAPTPAPVMPTPRPTIPPNTPPPTFAPLVQDGGVCDKDGDCQSGACSATRLCLLSTGSPCESSAMCANAACLNGICGACVNSNSILSKNLMQRSFAAAQLTLSLQLGYQSNPPVVTPTSVSFYNMNTNNKSMVAKVNGVCYGIFAPKDTTTLDPIRTVPITIFQQTCQIHERADSAYFTDDRQFFELQLAQCSSSCTTSPQQGVSKAAPQRLAIQNEVVSPQNMIPAALVKNACPIVLAGHGMGGAAAIVGSLVMADLQPTVITFGAPRTVSSNCGLLKPTAMSKSHYRYVNLEFVPAHRTHLFDAIPQIGNGALHHYGNPILLDVKETIVLPINDNTTRAHAFAAKTPSQLSLYNERIAALNTEGCYPIPAASSWQNGHWCDRDDVCLSGSCRAFVTLANGMSTGLCGQKAMNGEACLDNGDCVSNVCNAGACLGGGTATAAPGTPPPATAGPAPVPPTSAPPPLAGGEGVEPCGSCSSNNDCLSGLCSTFFVPGAPDGTASVCAETADGKMNTGCFCDNGDNNQCTEGRCEGADNFFLCLSPLVECEACDEGSDCRSGNCEEGVCGLESGGLPDDCFGGNGNCLLCDSTEKCVTSIGDGSICMMGVCTLESGLLGLGCPCPPRNGDVACASGICALSDDLMTKFCVDGGNGGPVPIRVSGAVGHYCMINNQCNSGSCTLKCKSQCSWTCD